MEESAQKIAENPINEINKKSKTPLGLFIGMALGLLFFLLILVTLNYFAILELNKILPSLFSSLPQQSNQKTLTDKESTTKKPIAKIPKINANNPNLKSAFVTYSFSAKIKEITGNKNDKTIVTDVKIKGIPKITLTSATKIYFLTTNKIQNTSIDSLQTDQTIIVYMTYNLKTSKWQTSSIQILSTKNTTTASPSASAK